MSTIGNVGQPYQMPPKSPCTHDENCPKDAQNMPGHRHRSHDGTLKAKRGDTHLGSLEDKYGEISHMPDDTHLNVLRAMTGKKGINQVSAEMHKLEKGNK